MGKYGYYVPEITKMIERKVAEKEIGLAVKLMNRETFEVGHEVQLLRGMVIMAQEIIDEINEKEETPSVAEAMDAMKEATEEFFVKCEEAGVKLDKEGEETGDQ